MSLATELSLDTAFDDLRHEAVLNVIHSANMLSAVGAVFFRKYDLTEAQFNVLFALKYKQCDLTQSELSKRLVVTRASITSVLDKLEEKKFVERGNVPGNRRIYHVSLTEQGARLIDEVEPLYRDEIQFAMAKLSDSECHALIELLERVRARTRDRLVTSEANPENASE